MQRANSTLNGERPSSVYLHTGIGGRGNYHKFTPPEDVTPISTSPQPPQSQRTRLPRLQALFSSGVGGAGNIHPISEIPSLTVEEEQARTKIRESNSPLSWFVGIGGLGNRRRTRHGAKRESIREESDSDFSEKALPVGMAEMLRVRLRQKMSSKKRAKRNP